MLDIEFLCPQKQIMDKKKYIEITDLTDIDVGHSKSFTINDMQILVCRSNNGVFAVEDRCSHSDIPLCGGLIEGNYITCPLHGAVFDLRDGSVQSPPAFEDIKTYEVIVDGTIISIEEP